MFDTTGVKVAILINEVIIVRYKPFWPGDNVIIIVDYNGTPSGTTGKVVTKLAGTAYLVRIPDGSFRWLHDDEFRSADPDYHRLQEGDIGVVTSDKHQHGFAKIGDMFQVYKVAFDVDYYGVAIGDEIKWFGGFQLAKEV